MGILPGDSGLQTGLCNNSSRGGWDGRWGEVQEGRERCHIEPCWVFDRKLGHVILWSKYPSVQIHRICASIKESHANFCLRTGALERTTNSAYRISPCNLDSALSSIPAVTQQQRHLLCGRPCISQGSITGVQLVACGKYGRNHSVEGGCWVNVISSKWSLRVLWGSRQMALVTLRGWSLFDYRDNPPTTRKNPLSTSVSWLPSLVGCV